MTPMIDAPIIDDLGPDYAPLLDAIARVVEEAVGRRTEALADELARLRSKIQRPDLVKHSIPEACERLGRSRSSVYELIAAGELTPVKERGRTFLTEEEIQRWERIQRN